MKKNIFEISNFPLSGERFDTLLSLSQRDRVKVERIISAEQLEPGELYDQLQDEWVIVLQGSSLLEIEGKTVKLVAGDYAFLPSHCKHRVLKTDSGTVWLAIHMFPKVTSSQDNENENVVFDEETELEEKTLEGLLSRFRQGEEKRVSAIANKLSNFQFDDFSDRCEAFAITSSLVVRYPHNLSLIYFATTLLTGHGKSLWSCLPSDATNILKSIESFDVDEISETVYFQQRVRCLCLAIFYKEKQKYKKLDEGLVAFQSLCKRWLKNNEEQDLAVQCALEKENILKLGNGTIETAVLACFTLFVVQTFVNSHFSVKYIDLLIRNNDFEEYCVGALLLSSLTYSLISLVQALQIEIQKWTASHSKSSAILNLLDSARKLKKWKSKVPVKKRRAYLLQEQSNLDSNLKIKLHPEGKKPPPPPIAATSQMSHSKSNVNTPVTIYSEEGVNANTKGLLDEIGKLKMSLESGVDGKAKLPVPENLKSLLNKLDEILRKEGIDASENTLAATVKRSKQLFK
eukprot:g2125.t1